MEGKKNFAQQKHAKISRAETKLLFLPPAENVHRKVCLVTQYFTINVSKGVEA